MACMAVVQRIGHGPGQTWTVLGSGWGVVEPAETYLEFLRDEQSSPHTVKAYAHGLAAYWSFLEAVEGDWRAATPATIGAFLARLRDDDATGRVIALPAADRDGPSPATVSLRLRAVMSFYRFWAANDGVPVAGLLYERVLGRPGPYRPFLDHLARKSGRLRSRLRVRRDTRRPPLFTPEQVTLIVDAAAVWDAGERRWMGNLRNRLLWSLLAETGLRLGEALSLQHRDWRSGHGDTASIEVVSRQHPLGVRTKSGPRRVYIGADLDRLYADYVWLLCDRGIDGAVADLDGAYVFCNLDREPVYGPLSPSTVYEHVRSIKRRERSLPAAWTPHWFRHTHATALLLAGVEPIIVSRRLGHASVETTLNTYAWVTADAEMRTVANWRAWTAGWGAASA
jgi:site-specific recombinase XerD